jgi:hypothetical protein
VPWQPAFDDFWFLPETSRWVAAGRLGTDATFARVPLWHGALALSLVLFQSKALLVLQGGIVLATIAGFASWVGPAARAAVWLPLAVFLLSPQILLYSRQSVNELFIGALAVAIMLLGERRGARAALPLGALVGVAACTKPVAALLGILALGYALRGGARAVPTLARLALGFALVVVPVFVFAGVQRGSWLFDNTAAFNLSGLSLEEWQALPDAATRQQAGMERWREQFSAAPFGYLASACGRAVVWLLRPSSLDFGLFYPGYPLVPLAAGDVLAFAALSLLAAFGTTRRDAFVWWLLAGLVAACAFPLFTPRSPKIIWLFPALLLAARGAQRVSDRMAAGRTEGSA